MVGFNRILDTDWIGDLQMMKGKLMDRQKL